MEPEKTPNSQSSPKNEYQSWRHHNPGLKDVLLSCNEDNMVLAQKQTHRSMEQNGEFRKGPSNVWPTNLQQSRKYYPMDSQWISANVVGKSGQQHAEE